MYSDFASRSPSQPIKIKVSSKSTESYLHHRDESDSSSTSSSHVQQLDENLVNADMSPYPSRFDDLTVGSLPAVRIGKRYIISDGHDSRNYLGFANQGEFQNQADETNQNNDFEYSKSLPVPRAPYLHSRTDRVLGESLSR